MLLTHSYKLPRFIYGPFFSVFIFFGGGVGEGGGEIGVFFFNVGALREKLTELHDIN